MKQAMYYINLLQEEMKFNVTPVPIHEDNQGAIILAQQPTVSMKSRHIAFRHHLRQRASYGVQEIRTQIH